jgi:hypothetical protein
LGGNTDFRILPDPVRELAYSDVRLRFIYSKAGSPSEILLVSGLAIGPHKILTSYHPFFFAVRRGIPGYQLTAISYAMFNPEIPVYYTINNMHNVKVEHGAYIIPPGVDLATNDWAIITFDDSTPAFGRNNPYVTRAKFVKDNLNQQLNANNQIESNAGYRIYLIGNQTSASHGRIAQIAQWSQIIPSDIRKNPISSGTVILWTGYKPPAPFELKYYNLFSILTWPRSELGPNNGATQPGDSGGMAIFCKPKTAGSKILICSIMGIITGGFMLSNNDYFSDILTPSFSFYSNIPNN